MNVVHNILGVGGVFINYIIQVHSSIINFLCKYPSSGFLFDLIIVTFFVPQFLSLVKKCLSLVKYFKKTESELIFKNNYRCIMITGKWGTGKTHYYERELKNKIRCQEMSCQIKISCFGSTKTELITQIIMAQWLFRILSINGILVKLFQDNWKYFFPKNTIIVFDDFERLHNSNENFLDIIGVIDYLKKYNKIIIIAAIDQINNNILNAYLERVVDTIVTEDVFTKGFADILKHQKIDLDKLISDDDLDKKVLGECVTRLIKDIDNMREEFGISNLRLMLNIWPHLIKGIASTLKTYEKDIDKKIIVSYKHQNFLLWIKLRYAFFSDRKSFEGCFSKKAWLDKINRDYSGNKDNKENEEYEKCKAKLKEYGLSDNDFSSISYTQIYSNNYAYILKDYQIKIDNTNLIEYVFGNLLPECFNFTIIKEQIARFIEYREDESHYFWDKSKPPILDYKNQPIMDSKDFEQLESFRRELMNSTIINNIKQSDLDWSYSFISRVAGGHGYYFENCVGIAILLMISKENNLGLDSVLEKLLTDNKLELPLDESDYNEDGFVNHLLICGSKDLLRNKDRVYVYNTSSWNIDYLSELLIYNIFLWLVRKDDSLNTVFERIKQGLTELFVKYLEINYKQKYPDDKTRLPLFLKKVKKGVKVKKVAR